MSGPVTVADMMARVPDPDSPHGRLILTILSTFGPETIVNDETADSVRDRVLALEQQARLRSEARQHREDRRAHLLVLVRRIGARVEHVGAVSEVTCRHPRGVGCYRCLPDRVMRACLALVRANGAAS